MTLFTRRERLIIGFLIVTALILAVVRYVQIHRDIAVCRRGEVLRGIDDSPHQ